MAQNYILLERIELNASAASVTFSNIPQTGYTDLKIVVSGRTNRAANGDDINISFNGSSTSFSRRRIFGTGSSVSSDTGTQQIGILDGGSDTANTFGSMEIYIPNYAGSTNKSYSVDAVSENNATTAYTQLTAGLWSNTAAITSITLQSGNSASWVLGSTFSLYGIANASTTPAIAPKADGGNVIATDGTYWYHAFLSNGTFTPQVGLSADVLVVAGGGAGAATNGAGGGAGGVFYATSQSLNGTYTCAIGAGGAGNSGAGSVGTDSTFGSLTAAKGGGNGGYGSAGTNGGSGGGGYGNDVVTPAAGGSSTQSSTGGTGYGNAGGTYTYQGYLNAGNGGAGGGGAGAAGSPNTSGKNGGNGGAGLNTWSSWVTTCGVGASGYVAGGGGGSFDFRIGSAAGSGGAGGGGAGSSGAGTAGTVNTGSGGGGSGYNGSIFNGASGGSGVVIIRYAV